MASVELIDQTIDDAITDRRIVGAVMMVSHQGDLVYQKAFGMADREARRPMQTDAIFRLSSVTKPIVAATILALADAGLLRLDDAVDSFFPEFRPKLSDGSVPKILIWQLLTHTSGLAAGPLPWSEGTNAVLSTIAGRPLLFAPGTSWSYGPSIDVLGAIAGKLVGGRPEDALRQFVLDPLGMADTRFSVTDRSRLAVPYGDGPNGPERMKDVHVVKAPWGDEVRYDPPRIFNPDVFQSGGGGMAGSARDIMTFLETMRRGGEGVLKSGAVRSALANQTPSLAQAVEPGWGFSFLGACLTDKDKTSHRGALGTNRWGGIYGHHWVVDPANELTILSMTNTGLEGSDGRYRHDTTDAIYRALGL
ncbi:hypothetical protein VW35_04570 [Devosia soli]|uniref:Beta-lactamase-related domain-containing protein n=1 Tax=Devosia soli TaxID=361041 RepID=A0A0F5LBQ9_9HYPH|nr:serine hydrolase domain-containing protein [Devosia soli]KKB79783.1 hypothetical protein VW35_04570 [Devosia soli]